MEDLTDQLVSNDRRSSSFDKPGSEISFSNQEEENDWNLKRAIEESLAHEKRSTSPSIEMDDLSLKRAIEESLAAEKQRLLIEEEDQKLLQLIKEQSRKQISEAGREIPILDLCDEYKGNIHMRSFILLNLTSRYKSLRKVWGDGNCFYRCMIIDLVKAAKADRDIHRQLSRVFSIIRDIYKNFYQYFFSLQGDLTEDLILEGTKCLREIGSRKLSDKHFEPGLSGLGMSVWERANLMITNGEEAEQIDMIAVLMALPIKIKIKVVQFNKECKDTSYELVSPYFSSKDRDMINMDIFFTAGHYDLLYRK